MNARLALPVSSSEVNKKVTGRLKLPALPRSRNGRQSDDNTAFHVGGSRPVDFAILFNDMASLPMCPTEKPCPYGRGEGCPYL